MLILTSQHRCVVTETATIVASVRRQVESCTPAVSSCAANHITGVTEYATASALICTRDPLQTRGADPFVCELAALLHDIADEKLNPSAEAGMTRVLGLAGGPPTCRPPNGTTCWKSSGPCHSRAATTHPCVRPKPAWCRTPTASMPLGRRALPGCLPTPAGKGHLVHDPYRGAAHRTHRRVVPERQEHGHQPLLRKAPQAQRPDEYPHGPPAGRRPPPVHGDVPGAVLPGVGRKPVMGSRCSLFDCSLVRG
jgi:hypothetical protein